MKSSSCASMVRLVRRYLAHRRGFGYRLQAEGHDLIAFAKFLDRQASGQPLRTKLALQWIHSRPVQPVTRSGRLSTIRGFARFCATLDLRTQIPPQHLTPCGRRRRAPHIFTAAQRQLLLRRTQELHLWRDPLRIWTYRTLLGLLICAGLRPAEARRLTDEDFNARTGTLRVPAVKRGSERILPLHPSTVRALQSYQRQRQSHYPLAHHFFVGPLGRPLRMGTADWTFQGLVRGIPGNGARPRPRLYDLRHGFATHWIARWTRQSAPLAHRLVLLSRYLGHQHFRATYWYVQPQSCALRAAALRWERYHQTPRAD